MFKLSNYFSRRYLVTNVKIILEVRFLNENIKIIMTRETHIYLYSIVRRCNLFNLNIVTQTNMILKMNIRYLYLRV